MPLAPEALREIAASCLTFAKTSTDEAERTMLLAYATLYHDLAVTLEQLASLTKETRDH